MRQKVYMVVTFLLLGVSAAALANRYVLPKFAAGTAESGSTLAEAGSVFESGGVLGEPLLSDAALPLPEIEGPGEAAPLSLGGAASAEVEWSKSPLVVGIPTVVPNMQRVPLVSDVPWASREVGLAFRGRGAESAELIPPGNPVRTPLAAAPEGADAALGRVLAFAVGLKVDPLARRDLPAVSRGKIEGYLDGHRLAIQPSLYRAADGSYFLGPEVRAAFFALEDPEETIEPEGMIVTAVREFRSLGLYATDGVRPGRTLVMLFRYDAAEAGGVVRSTGRKREYELLFVHLLPSEPGEDPRVTVFCTGKGRQTLHALDVGDPLRATALPAVTATVRFDDFSMMGLYPQKPVVTGVRHAARHSIESQRFRRIMNGEDGADPVPLPEMLDRLAAGELPAGE